MSARKDFFTGCFFVFFGLFVVFLSMRLSVWSIGEPREGFFPLIIGIIIVGVSLLMTIKSLNILSRSKAKEEILEGHGNGKSYIIKLYSYIILMLLYGISIEKVGYLITSALFLMVALKFVEKRGWKSSILVTVAVTTISYVLFGFLLKVPLPEGLISDLLNISKIL